MLLSNLLTFVSQLFKTVFYTISRGGSARVGCVLNTKEYRTHVCNAQEGKYISTRTLRRSAAAADGGCGDCGTGERELGRA